MALEPGTRLGPYEIVELRGKGGMGEVYRARDIRLDRDVALKVLPAELAADETYRRRLEREARTISRLQHERVCRLYDIGSEGETRYLVMEYLEGVTLEERLREGSFPIEEVPETGAQIAEAVDAAHREGVVHRDLKPGNIVLTEQGVKVLDFGLARELVRSESPFGSQAATVAAITREWQLAGTMPYMAPEQLQGQAATVETDIWSLGCVLYEMAVGERPFQGQSQADLIAAIIGSDPEATPSKQPSASSDLDRVIMRCLEKNPRERWASAREVASALSGPSAVGSDATRRSASSRLALVTGQLMARGASLWRLWWGAGREVDEARQQTTRVAVLPFESFSTDPEVLALARSLAETVIGEAGRAAGPRHRILPRSASFEQAGQSAFQAAKALNADFVIEGSVSAVGERLRVGAQLYDCADGEQLWSRTYAQESENLLAAENQPRGQHRARSLPGSLGACADAHAQRRLLAPEPCHARRQPDRHRDLPARGREQPCGPVVASGARRGVPTESARGMGDLPGTRRSPR